MRTGFYDGGKTRNIYLHHYLIGFPLNGLEVDHINRNPLDNRKCNLRFVTRQENMKNQTPPKGFIFKRKDTGKYGVRIGRLYFGCYESRHKAIHVLKQAVTSQQRKRTK